MCLWVESWGSKVLLFSPAILNSSVRTCFKLERLNFYFIGCFYFLFIPPFFPRIIENIIQTYLINEFPRKTGKIFLANVLKISYWPVLAWAFEKFLGIGYSWPTSLWFSFQIGFQMNMVWVTKTKLHFCRLRLRARSWNNI